MKVIELKKSGGQLRRWKRPKRKFVVPYSVDTGAGIVALLAEFTKKSTAEVWIIFKQKDIAYTGRDLRADELPGWERA